MLMVTLCIPHASHLYKLTNLQVNYKYEFRMAFHYEVMAHCLSEHYFAL